MSDEYRMTCLKCLATADGREPKTIKHEAPCNGGPIVTESPERAGREGDSQPMPTPNDYEDIQSIVIEDIKTRRVLGIQRYGTPLRPFNGRNALQDAYEEALDLSMYLRQAIIERDYKTSNESNQEVTTTWSGFIKRVWVDGKLIKMNDYEVHDLKHFIYEQITELKYQLLHKERQIMATLKDVQDQVQSLQDEDGIVIATLTDLKAKVGAGMAVTSEDLDSLVSSIKGEHDKLATAVQDVAAQPVVTPPITDPATPAITDPATPADPTAPTNDGTTVTDGTVSEQANP